MKRILCTEGKINKTTRWLENTISAEDIFKKWNDATIFLKSLLLTINAKKFDVILFYHFPLLPFLFLIFSFPSRFTGSFPIIIFQEFICDVGYFKNDSINLKIYFKKRLSFFIRKVCLKLSDKIIVHSLREIEIYSETFKISKDKFAFVPYFAYQDAINEMDQKRKKSVELPHLVSVGGHRDYCTLVEAVRDLKCILTIVCTDSDMKTLSVLKQSDNIRIYVDVPFSEYRRIMDNADILILPFKKDFPHRAAGHIAYFEAVQRLIPVITSRTFHLEDYGKENVHFFCYQAENSLDLRERIEFALNNKNYSEKIARDAFDYVIDRFTHDIFVNNILEICNSIK